MRKPAGFRGKFSLKLFKKWSDGIAAAIQERTPLAGRGGVSVDDSPDGRAINAGAGLGGAASATYHAFSVTVRATPGDPPPGTLDRIIDYRSVLLKSIATVETISITGLATEDEPEDDDDGWALFIANDLIWLEVDFTDGAPSSASIKSYGAGDDWPDFTVGATTAKSFVEWSGAGTEGDPFVQTKARAVIARAPADGAGEPRLIQVAHTDFLLTLWDIDGKVMFVPEPFAGGLE